MNVNIASLMRLAVLLFALSAAAVSSPAASLTVLGSFGGQGVGVVEGATLQAASSGTGTASHIGRFTYTVLATVSLPTATSNGLFLMSFSNGNVIFGSFSGREVRLGHVVETLTIHGGTGRFQGATGSLTFDRVFDLSSLPAFESHVGTVAGAINTQSSTH